MDDPTFSVLTSVYTVGGLLGSLGANVVMDRWGRKGAILASSFIMAVGAGFMGVAASLSPLIFGRCVPDYLVLSEYASTLIVRLFTGVAAGLGLCVGPIYIAEIAPSKIKGSVGQYSTVSSFIVFP